MSLINVRVLTRPSQGRPILQDINFSIGAGGMHRPPLVPNGAGKTTLIELLLHDQILSQRSSTIKGDGSG